MKRQGELLIVKVKEIPVINHMNFWVRGTTPETRLKNALQDHTVLAEGEATGHFHALDKGKLYKFGRDSMYFEIPEKEVASLTHPEHDTIKFDSGIYKVIIQREYSEKSIRQVRD